MSYILDALKKADRERSLGDVPDLEAAHWGVRRDQGPRRWLWIVAVLLIINAALLAWMLGGRNGDEVEQPRGEIVPMAPPPRMTQVPAPVAVAPPAGVPDRSGTPDVDSRAAQDQPGSATVEADIAPVQAVTVVRPKVAVRPHVAPPAGTPASAAGSGAATASRVVQAQEPLSESAPEDAAGIPELGELPLEFRSGFQQPRIDVHVYSDEPPRRFILVDLQKFREGDTLQNGAVLEKILPNSIQLFYQGRRFRVDR